MACTSCINKISGVCKVCQLVDGNVEVKTVSYCDTCGVYICQECNGNLVKRMKAFLALRLKITI